MVDFAILVAKTAFVYLGVLFVVVFVSAAIIDIVEQFLDIDVGKIIRRKLGI